MPPSAQYGSRASIMDIFQVLKASISPNAEERNAAIQFLENAANSNYTGTIESLSTVLSNERADTTVRSSAGLYLKNMLTSRTPSSRAHFVTKWLELDSNFRQKIKFTILNTLFSEPAARTCAQIISAIAFAEFPGHSWPELLPTLTAKITSDSSIVKEACIEAVGYLCQDLPQSVLMPYSSDLLNNVVTCMKADQSPRVRLVAARALLYSLESIERNFEVEAQRNLIMQQVCECAITPDAPVRVAGLQCLAKIVTLYYGFMEPYMTHALFSITFDALKVTDDDVALQGIEFWSSLGEEEYELDEMGESSDQGTSSSEFFKNRHYCRRALPYLLPCLLERLCVDSGDEECWDPHKAASVCLMLLARTCGGELTPHLLPFVGANFRHTEATRRDSALIALGALLESADSNHLPNIINNSHPVLIELARDPDVRVRDSVLWALGKLYERRPSFSLELEATLRSLAAAYEGLKDVPRVATNACWAFYFIVSAMYEVALEPGGDRPSTLPISSQYESLVAAVHATIKRDDAGASKLRAAAFELLNKLIECHPRDMHHVLTTNFSNVLHECSQLFNALASSHGVARTVEVSQYQSMYCLVLQNYFKVLDIRELAQLAEPLLHSLINYLRLARHSSVQEDVLLTVGVLIVQVPQNVVERNIPAIMPYLIECLSKSSETSLCVAAASVLGDMCSTVPDSIQTFSSEIISILFRELSSAAIEDCLKAPLVSLFGDLALALGSNYRQYLSQILELLRRITVSTDPDECVDTVELVDDTRAACLETYTSLVQGIYQNGTAHDDFGVWMPYIPHILQLIETVSSDPHHSDHALCSSCGLLGDLIHTFKASVKSSLNDQLVHRLMHEASNSSAPKTKTVGVWLQKLLDTVH